MQAAAKPSCWSAWDQGAWWAPEASNYILRTTHRGSICQLERSKTEREKHDGGGARFGFVEDSRNLLQSK